MLGRKLLLHESVHHRDGDKLNNDPTNLELWIMRQPNRNSRSRCVNWAFEITARYADEPQVWIDG